MAQNKARESGGGAGPTAGAVTVCRRQCLPSR
jgi:hypothetical protein